MLEDKHLAQLGKDAILSWREVLGEDAVDEFGPRFHEMVMAHLETQPCFEYELPAEDDDVVLDIAELVFCPQVTAAPAGATAGPPAARGAACELVAALWAPAERLGRSAARVQRGRRPDASPKSLTWSRVAAQACTRCRCR